MIKLTHFGYHVKTHKDSSVVNPDPVDAQDGCFDPDRDIVIPPLHESGNDGAVHIYKQLTATHGQDPTRTTLLLFAGECLQNQKRPKPSTLNPKL